MANTLFERTIAFAGICQSVRLVQEIARTGKADEDAIASSLNSIVIVNPQSTLAVYEKEANLKVGLSTLISEFNNTSNGNELTRYLINLLALERKLVRNQVNMGKLADRISTIERQLPHYDNNLLDEQIIKNLASIYLDIISPLGPRIQITGDPTELQQVHNQNKIRALLLAGIRGAVLWRQIGGKRRHLIFGRKQMAEQAKLILARNS